MGLTLLFAVSQSAIINSGYGEAARLDHAAPIALGALAALPSSIVDLGLLPITFLLGSVAVSTAAAALVAYQTWSAEQQAPRKLRSHRTAR